MTVNMTMTMTRLIFTMTYQQVTGSTYIHLTSTVYCILNSVWVLIAVSPPQALFNLYTIRTYTDTPKHFNHWCTSMLWLWVNVKSVDSPTNEHMNYFALSLTDVTRWCNMGNWWWCDLTFVLFKCFSILTYWHTEFRVPVACNSSRLVFICNPRRAHHESQSTEWNKIMVHFFLFSINQLH